MKVIRKHPGGPAEFIDIDGSLESLQKEVDGYIEAVPLFEKIIMICNEDGKWKGLEENFPVQFKGVYGDTILGTVLFVREDGGNFGSVAEEDMSKLCSYLGLGEMGFPVDE